MGNRPSRQSLPPAEEIVEAPYELLSLRYLLPLLSPRCPTCIHGTDTFTNNASAVVLHYASSCRAPRLTGRLLRAVVWLLESPFGGLVFVKILRDSGVPQAVRELDVPELATFQPLWPHPDPAAHPQDARDAVAVQGQPVRERLGQAALAIPGPCPSVIPCGLAWIPLMWHAPACSLRVLQHACTHASRCMRMVQASCRRRKRTGAAPGARAAGRSGILRTRTPRGRSRPLTWPRQCWPPRWRRTAPSRPCGT